MAAEKLRGLLLQVFPPPAAGQQRRVALFGSSNGGRMSAFFAAKVAPEMTAALVLNNITAGEKAAQVLSHEYYLQARQSLYVFSLHINA